MQSFGQLLLVLAFVVGCATLLIAVYGAVSKRPGWMRGARAGLLAMALISIAMAAVLTHGFLTHAFENRYISQYSDRSMPLVYLLASFWGGERGALLFWVLSLSVFANIAVWARRDREQVYMTWVTALLSAAILFFLVLMVFQTSPFDTWMVNAIPEDGEGLNPLLQNPVMAFHPPALLTGYILFTIPFAFGMAALITRRLDDQWIADTRRWTIVSWIFLSIGLLLGCRWAYMEIGWGFWWMWDAVENAGLIPWFTATAYLHSVMIQERRGMLKRWNVILLSLTFLLTIFGTFLTRSQLIVSIHAFADSEIAEYFLVYLVIIFVFAAIWIIKRWRDLRSEARIDSFMSREAMFVLNNVVLVFCAFVTLYGTLMAKITETAFSLDEPIAWDENTFNGVFVWIGLILLVVMGIGPLISWRRATWRNFQRNFLWPLAWGSISTLVVALVAIYGELKTLSRVYQTDFSEAYDLWLRGIDGADWISVIVYFLCAFVLFSVLREFHVAARARSIKKLGRYFGNLVVVTFKNPRRYGGYIIHIGIVFLFIAFTGKAFKTEEKDRVINVGQTHTIEHYAMTLVAKDRRYSVEDGCVINDATFVVIPARTTVAESSLTRLDEWLRARQTGAYHVTTEWDSPRMLVRFADPAQRDKLMAEYYLVRHFLPRFQLQREDTPGLAQRWTYSDTGLLQAMPMAAMQNLREARDALSGAVFGATAELAGGSAVLTLNFDSPEALARFQSTRQATMPEWVLSLLDDSEAGAIAVVDRSTGQILVPESRFYPVKGQFTTEVSISQADFLVDVYLSMQPDMAGAPYVKVFAVIFPFVNFLWLGGLLLMLGAVVALSPRWVGQTLQSFLGTAPAEPPPASEPSPPATKGKGATGVLPLLLAAALGWAALGGGPARAHEAPSGGVEPHGFPAPGANPLAEVWASVDCACPAAPTEAVVALGDPACGCPVARAERALVADLFRTNQPLHAGDGRLRFETLKALVAVNAEWESRLRYEEAIYRDLVKTTRTTCPGEFLMTLDATRATCSVKIRWLSIFRLLLASGVHKDAIYDYYLAENNATMADSMNGGAPWEPHELRTSNDMVTNFWVPVWLLGGAFLLVALLVTRNFRRRRNTGEREQRGAALSDDQRERLKDELDVYDA